MRHAPGHNTFYSLAVYAVATLGAAAMTGCSLPAVTADFTLAGNQTLPGSLVSIPLLGLPLIPGATCNLPGEEDFEQVVRDSIGPFLSRFVRVESVVLQNVTLAVHEDSPADFSRITGVEVVLYLLDLDGLRLDTVPLASGEDSGGFGSRMQLAVQPPLDIVELVRTEAECGAVSVKVSGFSPAQDVVFDLSATARIGARLAFW